MRGRRRRGYRELLLLLGILAFASSMTGSFWVVFLAQRYGLAAETIAALFAGATFIAAAGCLALSRFPAIPATRAILAGLACLAGMQVALALVPGPALYVLFAVLYGLYIPLFWLPWNTLVADQTRLGDRGAKLAGVTFAYNLAAAGGPFVGGLLAVLLGFPALFLLGAALVAAAAIVAAALSQDPDGVRLVVSIRRLGAGTAGAYLAQGGIDGILWTAIPLVTLSFVQGEVELGALFSLFALAGGAFGVALGRWSDRIRHRRRFIALGAALAAPMAVGAALASSLAGFALANGLLSAALVIGPTFVNAIAVDRLEGEAGLVMTTRELLLNLARGTTSVAVLALSALGVRVQPALFLIVLLLPLMAAAARAPAMGFSGGARMGGR